MIGKHSTDRIDHFATAPIDLDKFNGNTYNSNFKNVNILKETKKGGIFFVLTKKIAMNDMTSDLSVKAEYSGKYNCNNIGIVSPITIDKFEHNLEL
jgi:hypothetical protein